MRKRVEALLQAHDAPGTFLDRPATAEEISSDIVPGQFIDPQRAADVRAAGFTPAEAVGSRIGPYKLLQLLGEGGMGSVWMAEQEEPVKRRVAVKIIKTGLDSSRFLARFEAERQALAMMDHPNIAKVLDAGAVDSCQLSVASKDKSDVSSLTTDNLQLTTAGRPYFVMELVKGIPITKYCDQEHLTPKERLELFIPVCQAVQHAHQKGVIHRDIKPSNVLIALYDGKPVPKVIDFGVAKATAQKLTERTMFTEVGQIVGTLEYMAPEQAELNNLDIDTRADIYSLGVLLYELLTGSPPFTSKQLRSAGFQEMLRIIREVEPPKPSTKLSSSEELPSIAAHRKLEPARLTRLVKGDLDWIVMKCLEKERGRRYETANGLAMDMQRYLADEPVLASPPSAGYRLRKFIRKHRGPVLAAGVIAVLLLGGIIGTSLGFLRAERLRKVAENKEQEALEERTKTEAFEQRAMEALRVTTDEVIEKLIGAKRVLGPTEKEFLEKSLERWHRFAAEQGDTERSRAIRAEGLFRVARLMRKLGRVEESGATFERAIAIWHELAENFPGEPAHRQNLGLVYNQWALMLANRDRSRAEAACRQALGILEKLAANFPAVSQYRQSLAGIYNNMGNLFKDGGKLSEAETSYRKALTIRQKLAADLPTAPQYRQELAASYNSLGLLFNRMNNLQDAETLFRDALAVYDKLLLDFPAQPSHRQEQAKINYNLGIVLAGQGKGAEAIAVYRQALVGRRKLADDFPALPEYRQDVASSCNRLAVLLTELGKLPEAEATHRQALAILEKLAADFPAEPSYRQDLARSHSNVGLLLVEQRKTQQAEAAFRQALGVLEKLVGDFPAVPEYRADFGRVQLNLGELLRRNRRLEDAMEYFTGAIEALEGGLHLAHDNASARKHLWIAHANRALVHDELKHYAEAAQDWDKAAKLSPEKERPQFRIARAASRVRAGQVDTALKDAEELATVPHPVFHYNAACVFALAADRRDVSGGSLSKEQCAKRAVELLRLAVAKGYKDAEHMKKDDDLKALRERDDFKKLLAELESRSK